MELLVKFVLVIFPILISVAFLTLLERKVLSLIGVRVGPNKVSFLGVFQPLGDALKLSNKSINLLTNFSFMFYYWSSFFMLVMSLILITCFYLFPTFVSFKYSILFFFIILGFNSFNSMVSGWSTFGKYPLMGSLRTVSQLISYESVLYFCLFSIIIIFFSFDFSSFSFLSPLILFIFLIPCFYIWIPTFLAELNRTPYDFSEGESELVSGFNTEYGSVGFTLVFLAEYTNILFFCVLTSFLFGGSSLGGCLFWIFFVLWIRSVLPRFRFDKLMNLAWKLFVPLMTLYFLFLILTLV